MSKGGKRFDHDAFQASLEDVILSSLGVHPDEMLQASILADLRRSPAVGENRHRMALVLNGVEPVLNAKQSTIEKDLRKEAFDSSGKTHAKDRLYKTILVKPTSVKASRVMGSWSQHTWKVFTLKFSSGLVLVNHRGEETSVFPGWGKMKSTLESLGFQVIK